MMGYAKRVLSDKWGSGKSTVSRFSNLEAGIYIDVSLRKGGMSLGFVVVYGEQVRETFSMQSPNRCTDSAELQAILIARESYPDLKCFCDNKAAVRMAQNNGHRTVTLISRKINGLAHRAARERINPRGTVASGYNRAHKCRHSREDSALHSSGDTP